MPTLKEQIQEDLKTAMRALDQHTLITLRGLSAAVKQIEVDTRKELDDEQVAKVITQEIKKRRDALPYAEKQQRQDLIEQNQAELAMLQKYLGQPLSQEELGQLIDQAIAAGADNIGKIMGALNKEYKGRFDGKVASELSRSKLEKKS